MVMGRGMGRGRGRGLVQELGRRKQRAWTSLIRRVWRAKCVCVCVCVCVSASVYMWMSAYLCVPVPHSIVCHTHFH